MARVTVLITTYNHEAFVAQAIASVQRQTFRDFEIVIADDGSTDQTVARCRERAGPGARLHRGTRVGYSRNWARGLERCDGELVAFLSGDDTWLPHHLAVAVAALESDRAAAFSYSFNEHVDEQLRPLRRQPRFAEPPPSGLIEPGRLLETNAIETHSVVVRRAALESVGGVDSSLLFADVDLFLRLARRYPIVHTGELTAQYRRHASGMSRDPQLMLEGWLALYSRHLDGNRALARRRLLAGRYLDAAYGQARLEPGSSLARRNLANAMRRWPPAVLDQRFRSAARAGIRRPRAT